MAKELRERIPSPAKAAVAQQKPRDAEGKFLSGAALQQYRAQQQQAQFSAERDRMSSMLGRSVSPNMPMQQSPMPMQPAQPQMGSSFEAIINANKPGGMAAQLGEEDKWAVLLGKKKRIL